MWIDSWASIVNSTVDPTLIDPSYGVETAQRAQINFTISTAKFPSGFGGTTWASYQATFNTSPGHTWTLLASLSNTHYPTIEPGDIVAGATAESFGSLQAQLNAEFAAQNAAITSGLSNKMSYTEIPYATRRSNMTFLQGFTGASTYSTWNQVGSNGLSFFFPASPLGIPSNAKIIRVNITYMPIQSSGAFWTLGNIPVPTGSGLMYVWANNRDAPAGNINMNFNAQEFRVTNTNTFAGDPTDAGFNPSVFDEFSRVHSKTIDLDTGVAIGQSFTGVCYMMARNNNTQNWGALFQFIGYWL